MGQFRRDDLKWYKAVFFQVGQENYPVWTVAQKETIKLYHDGGARFVITGHDIGWIPGGIVLQPIPCSVRIISISDTSVILLQIPGIPCVALLETRSLEIIQVVFPISHAVLVHWVIQ